MSSKIRYLTLRLLLICIIVTGCAKKEVQAPKEQPGLERPASESGEGALQQKVLAFNLEGLTENGTKKWEVNGKSAEAISENEIKLDDIVAKSYGEEAEATITADRGIYDKSKNNVKLEENVKATIENTRAFAKDYGDFSSGLTGSTKKSDDAKEGRKKARTIITCDGEAAFDHEKNLGYFNENVKVHNDDGDIDADRITVYLDSNTKKIQEIVAEGNVKITNGENTTYSDKATYIESEKKVVLTGTPRLVIYREGELGENF